MRVLRAVWLTFWLMAALLWVALAGAQALRPVPPLNARVMDQTATLTPPQVAALEAKLAAFEAEAGPQIVVLLVPGTAPEDIAAYAQRVADQWKIGRREVGDGLLLVVAKDERTLRIEVAKALEGAVPDLAARQIIDQTLVPAFRNNDYAGGLNQAVDRLMARVRGEGLPAPVPRAATGQRGARSLEEIGLMVFVGVMALGGLLGAVFGRGPGSLLTAAAAGGAVWWLGAGLWMAVLAAVAAVIVVGVIGVGNVLQLVLMARGGGGGGGRGGGGFSSGGGGDFGGGGASGRW